MHGSCPSHLPYGKEGLQQGENYRSDLRVNFSEKKGKSLKIFLEKLRNFRISPNTT